MKLSRPEWIIVFLLLVFESIYSTSNISIVEWHHGFDQKSSFRIKSIAVSIHDPLHQITKPTSPSDPNHKSAILPEQQVENTKNKSDVSLAVSIALPPGPNEIFVEYWLSYLGNKQPEPHVNAIVFQAKDAKEREMIKDIISGMEKTGWRHVTHARKTYFYHLFNAEAYSHQWILMTALRLKKLLQMIRLPVNTKSNKGKRKLGKEEDGVGESSMGQNDDKSITIQPVVFGLDSAIMPSKFVDVKEVKMKNVSVSNGTINQTEANLVVPTFGTKIFIQSQETYFAITISITSIVVNKKTPKNPMESSSYTLIEEVYDLEGGTERKVYGMLFPISPNGKFISAIVIAHACNLSTRIAEHIMAKQTGNDYTNILTTPTPHQDWPRLVYYPSTKSSTHDFPQHYNQVSMYSCIELPINPNQNSNPLHFTRIVFRCRNADEARFLYTHLMYSPHRPLKRKLFDFREFSNGPIQLTAFGEYIVGAVYTQMNTIGATSGVPNAVDHAMELALYLKREIAKYFFPKPGRLISPQNGYYINGFHVSRDGEHPHKYQPPTLPSASIHISIAMREQDMDLRVRRITAFVRAELIENYEEVVPMAQKQENSSVVKHDLKDGLHVFEVADHYNNRDMHYYQQFEMEIVLQLTEKINAVINGGQNGNGPGLGSWSSQLVSGSFSSNHSSPNKKRKTAGRRGGGNLASPLKETEPATNKEKERNILMQWNMFQLKWQYCRLYQPLVTSWDFIMTSQLVYMVGGFGLITPIHPIGSKYTLNDRLVAKIIRKTNKTAELSSTEGRDKVLKYNVLRGIEKMDDKYRNEVRILLALDENVPFVDHLHRGWAFEDSNAYYFITKYTPYGDLTNMSMELAKRRRTRPNESYESCVRFHITCMLLGLKHVHDMGFIHRDLKGANVMVGGEGVDQQYSYIIDFGSAQYAGPNGVLTHPILGEPEINPKDLEKKDKNRIAYAYLPPEVWAVKPYNKQVDIWSVGVIAYELLVGHTLTEKRAEGDPDYVIGERDISPLLALKHVSPTAKDFVEQCLSIDPESRPGGSRSTLADIKNHPWFKLELEHPFDWEMIRKLEAFSPCQVPEMPKNAGIEADFVEELRKMEVEFSTEAQKECDAKVERRKVQKEKADRAKEAAKMVAGNGGFAQAANPAPSGPEIATNSSSDDD